jgi:hypothetical protein
MRRDDAATSRLWILLRLRRLTVPKAVLQDRSLENTGAMMAKKKKVVRREYTKSDVKELRAHSKARTPVAKIAKLTKRSVGSLRQKATKLGIGLGHRR